MVQSHSETTLMYTSDFLQDGLTLGDVRTWLLLEAALRQNEGISNTVAIIMVAVKIMTIKKHSIHFDEKLYIVPWIPGSSQL